jgi:hypothetical protein
VEEQLNHRDKLFATAGIRTDQNSAFGRKVGNTVYPRASLSYVISEEDWFPRIAKISNMRLPHGMGPRRRAAGNHRRAGLSHRDHLSRSSASRHPRFVSHRSGIRTSSRKSPLEIEAGIDAGLLRFRESTRSDRLQEAEPLTRSSRGRCRRRSVRAEISSRT